MVTKEIEVPLIKLLRVTAVGATESKSIIAQCLHSHYVINLASYNAEMGLPVEEVDNFMMHLTSNHLKCDHFIIAV